MIAVVIWAVVALPVYASSCRLWSKVALAVADGATDALGPHGDGLSGPSDCMMLAMVVGVVGHASEFADGLVLGGVVSDRRMSSVRVSTSMNVASWPVMYCDRYVTKPAERVGVES